MHSTASGPASGASPGPAAGRRAAAAPVILLWFVTRGSVDVTCRVHRVRLDPDAYLVLDAACHAEARCASGDPAEVGVIGWTADELAEFECASFDGHLRPTRGPVGRRLQALADRGAATCPCVLAPDERRRLLAELVDEDRARRERADRIGSVKPATREELLRRILLAADFIQTHHDEPLSLDDMARAARLSRFHFLRLFTLVHAETPVAFLRRKRTAVARRHLELGGAFGDAAARAGFGSRSALFRSLRKCDPGAAPALRAPTRPSTSSCSLSA